MTTEHDDTFAAGIEAAVDGTERELPLTYWQKSCLRNAVSYGKVRRMTSPAIPSLVRRGLMRRWGGRPGHILYEITDAGRALIEKYEAESRHEDGPV